ncbi:hypothetical protein ABK040_005151 [Willaertia magna]
MPTGKNKNRKKSVATSSAKEGQSLHQKIGNQTEDKGLNTIINTSRNLHEELRNELFSESMVYPDDISFYYINDNTISQPKVQLSYKEALEAKSNIKADTNTPIKKPLLEEFHVDDPDKIDCTRKILVISKIEIKGGESSPIATTAMINDQQTKNNEASLLLRITLPIGYPINIPQFTIETMYGITESFEKELMEKLKSQCEESKGYPMLHQLITTCVDNVKEYVERLEQDYKEEIKKANEEKERKSLLNQQLEREVFELGKLKKQQIKERRNKKVEERLRIMSEYTPTPTFEHNHIWSDDEEGKDNIKQQHSEEEEEEGSEEEEEDSMEEDEEEEHSSNDEEDSESEEEENTRKKKGFFKRSNLVDTSEEEESEEELVINDDDDESFYKETKRSKKPKEIVKKENAIPKIIEESDETSSNGSLSSSLGFSPSGSPTKNFMYYYANQVKMQRKGSKSCESLETLEESDSRAQLLLIHLIKMFCNRQPQKDTFSELTEQLLKIGVLKSNMKPYIDNFSKFKTKFQNIFSEQMKSALETGGEPFISFWKEPKDELDSSLAHYSRYKTDFEELEALGEGGFGRVFKVRNKLDQRIYAIKKIKFNSQNDKEEKSILREVNLLSRLSHSFIVRYFNAWREVSLENEEDETIENEDFSTPEDSQFDYPEFSDIKSDLKSINQNKSEMASRMLYIQMEYCQETLKDVIDAKDISREQAWSFLRQTVEGLDYLHKNDIIHRDLKPSNLFVGLDNTIKIGDFGLSVAVKGRHHLTSHLRKSSEIALSRSGELSTGVGTATYAAPEVLTTKRYSSKVDIFSLGIIFFEMLHPKFGTGSERLSVIKEMRESHKVPSTFPALYAKEKEMIEWMLQPDPEKRPSAEQLLASEYMPPSETEEKLSILFNRKDKDLSISKEFNHAKVYYREQIILTLQSVFHLHGVVEFDVEQFVPNSDQVVDIVEKDKLCPVLFKTGKLANIPRDGSVSLARYLSRLPVGKEVKFLKRYSFISGVKQAGQAGVYTSQVCSIDIVGSRYKLITDTEILKIATTALSYFQPKRGEWIIRINHSSIIDAIMELCQIPKEYWEHICSCIKKIVKYNYSWKYVENELVNYKGVLKEKQLLMLKEIFKIRGDLQEVHQKLLKILIKVEALSDVATLISNLDVWKIDPNVFKVIFDTSLVNDYQRYSGIMFQIGIKNGKEYTAIVNGGRYDRMVSYFTLYERTPHHVVGANIKLDKLVRSTILLESPMSASKTKGGNDATTEEDENKLSHFESAVPLVLVYSADRGIREERMRVANMLWEAGIKTDLTYSDNYDYEAVKEYCKQHKVKFIVVTKSNLISRNLVRIRLSIDESENNKKKAKLYEIEKKDLVNYILSEGRERRKTTRNTTPSTVVTPSVSQDLLKESKVVFLGEKSTKHNHTIKQIALKKCNQYCKSVVEDSVVLVLFSIDTQEVKKVTELFYKGVSTKSSGSCSMESTSLVKFLKENKKGTQVYIYTARDDRVTFLIL